MRLRLEVRVRVRVSVRVRCVRATMNITGKERLSAKISAT
tara:strand:+ start:528 stop:647 length:120 start_codon:yes stop_codon:yes gene_type:complete